MNLNPLRYSQQQYGAVTGQIMPLDLSAYVRGRAEGLPGIVAARREAETLEEAEKGRRFAEKQAKWGTAIQAGALGIEAAPHLMPVARKFPRVLSVFQRERELAETAPSLVDTALEAGGGTQGLPARLPTPALTKPITPIAATPVNVPKVPMVTPVVTEPRMPQLAGGSTRNLGMGYKDIPTPGITDVAPEAITGAVAEPTTALQTMKGVAGKGISALGQFKAGQAVSEKFVGEGVGAEQEAARIGLGAATGAGTALTTALALGGPVGWAGLGVSALLGGVGGSSFGRKITPKECIIVSTCNSEDSEEVNITREYRDKYMTEKEIRGYYMLADRIVPQIKANKEYKEKIKETLVNPLIEYGKWAVGKTDIMPSIMSIFVTKMFLELCWSLGIQIDSYMRTNGEVV